MGRLQNVSTIIGLLSGVVGLITGVIGLYSKLHKPASQPTPVAAGRNQPADAFAPPNAVGRDRFPAQQAPQVGRHPAPGLPDLGPVVKGPSPELGAPLPPAPQPGARLQRFRAAQVRSQARKFRAHHPWILLAISSCFFLFWLSSRLAASGRTPAGNYIYSATTTLEMSLIIIVALGIYIGTVIVAARQSTRLHRWGWLVSVILIPMYGIALYGLFGPATQSARK